MGLACIDPAYSVIPSIRSVIGPNKHASENATVLKDGMADSLAILESHCH